jgi:hypothetical protein
MNTLDLNSITFHINTIKIIYPFMGHFCTIITLNFSCIFNVAVLICFQNSYFPPCFLRLVKYMQPFSVGAVGYVFFAVLN